MSLRFAAVFYFMWFGDGDIQVLLRDQVGNTSNQAISLNSSTLILIRRGARGKRKVNTLRLACTGRVG